MRILIVHEASAGAGGVESYLSSLIPALISRGHALAFLHYNPAGEAGPTRLDVFGMPRISAVDAGVQPSLDWVSAWHPDVCFSHNMRHLEVDGRLSARWPLVKMMHGYFGTCVSGQKAHAFPAAQVCVREFGPPCLALYLPRHCGRLRPLRMFGDYQWARGQRSLFDKYAEVVVASAYMAAEYRRHGVPDERLTAAPLFPTVAAPAAARQPPAEPVVLFLGRMTKIKGVHMLVEAVAAANRKVGHPIHLVMAGEGPEREPVQALARTLSVKATFPGWVQGPHRLDLLRNATVVALPSLWPEPFGLVGLEGAAHGVSSIAFDVGGVSEWLRDGVSGRLVRERGSAEAFGAILAEMLGDAPALRRLEAGALETARSLTIDSHLAILEPVLQRAAWTAQPRV
jgi:glycosyltransferase involved in cell wall biosynthesis